MDRSEELKWNYTEMLKVLIALSLEAEEQFNAYGDGPIGEEMALDFSNLYDDHRDGFLEEGLLNEEQVVALDALLDFFVERSGPQNEDFWLDVRMLSVHPDWVKVRKLAKDCLVVMGKDHLGIHVTIENSDSVNNEGEEIVVQMIFTEIYDKTAKEDDLSAESSDLPQN